MDDEPGPDARWSPRHAVKILYLKPDRGRPLFYADPAEVRADVAERPPGTLGRIGRKLAEVEARWKESEGSAAQWSRRLWDRLHSWSHPDEPLLAKLATADALVIRHPADVPERKVRSAWRRYLATRAGSHWFWLIVDGVLTPITGAVLWILPGPNVVFFWFAYRAYAHLAIVRAIHRARWSPPPTSFEADETLDRPVRPGDDGGHAHDAVADPEALRRWIERRDPDDAPDDSELDADVPSAERS